MTRRAIASAAAFVACACCVPVFPMGGEHPKGVPVAQQPGGWPAGLADLLNSARRVYSYWVNANDWFFYVGDTAEFNEFLKKYSALKGTPLMLLLHSGRGKTGRLGYGQKTIQYDWEVKVFRRGWHPEAPPDPTTTKPGSVVILEVWLGGEVELGKLKVPLNIRVKSGEKNETFTDFIADHEARHRKEEKTPNHQGTKAPGRCGHRSFVPLCLCGRPRSTGGSNLKEMPSGVKGIKVGFTFGKLHLLHATGWSEGHGVQVGSYVVNYEEGSCAEIPIEYGVHLQERWAPDGPSQVPGGQIVWGGKNGPIHLYKVTWENPHPNKVVKAIDYTSTGTNCAPFLVAMSAEQKAATCTTEGSKAPGPAVFRSEKPRYVKVALNKDGSKTLSVAFDESQGTGTGYDVLYADVNFNGTFEKAEKWTAATLKRGAGEEPQVTIPRLIITELLAPQVTINEEGVTIDEQGIQCSEPFATIEVIEPTGPRFSNSFTPIKLNVPYSEEGEQTLAHWQIAFGYHVSPASSPYLHRWGRIVSSASSVRTGEFRVAADLTLVQDLSRWRYFLSGTIEPSEEPQTALVWGPNRGLQLKLTTRPDGRKPGHLGIGLDLVAGKHELECRKEGQPVKAHVEIKNPDGTVVHTGEETLDKFTFG